MKDKRTTILHAFSPLIASLTIGMFLLSSCSNISVETDSSTGNITNQTTADESAGTKFLDEAGIEFTGNPAYDIGLLNEWWAKNGTPFQTSQEESSTTRTLSAARAGEEAGQIAINDFGDMISNFSGTSFLTWIGGAAIGGAISAGGSFLAGKLLDAMGIMKTQTHYFKEIIAKLERMEKQLDEIQNIVDNMHKNVKNLKTEIQYQKELTKYYTVMQQRNEEYKNIFDAALSCWNSIFDELVYAALISQYGENTVAYNAKKDELHPTDWGKAMELRLAYLDKFIDTASWLKAKKADEVSFNFTEEAGAFQAYCSKHSSEIGKKLNDCILNWGKKNSTGAKIFLSYLTEGMSPSTTQTFNMFQLYDKYAELNFVWEQEGYTLRQQLRDTDSALIALTAPLAYWYYAITELLGTKSTNCIEFKEYVNLAISLNKDNPVIKKDKPYYQKWGSKWYGQTFTGVIKENDYAKCMSDYWTINRHSSHLDGFPSKEQLPEVLRRVLNENFADFKGNASYFYSCNPPPAAATSSPCTAAENMAMPSEWYKEMFEAYKVNNRYKPLIKIFMDVGFISQYGNQIQTSASYRYETNEVLFVTSDSIYAKTITNNSDLTGTGTVFITSVIANSDVSLSRYNPQNQPIYEEWAVQYDCVIIKERKHGDTYYCTSKYRVPRKVSKSSHDYRKFYYPVKQ